MRESLFNIIYICVNCRRTSGSLPRLQTLLELFRQHRIELFQPPHDNRDFIPLSKPDMGSAQLKPGAGEFRFQARALPIRSDRAVEPIRIAICLSKKEER